MDCLHRCFGKTDEPDENLYSSLQEVIKGLKNIKDKQPESAEGMKNFITNMAQKYDRQIEENKAMAQKYNQQIKDIENMKKIINDITNSTKKIEELKEITSGLKNIEDNDKLNDVIGKITYNLLAVIKELKKSKDEEEQLLISLQKSKETEKRLLTELANAKKQMENDFSKMHKPNEADGKSSAELVNANNDINKSKIEINKKKLQAKIFAQSYAMYCNAPSIKNINKDNGTSNHLLNLFGKPTTVYFLSKEGKQLKGEELTKNYQSENFNLSQFYYLGEDGKYQILNNLEDIDSLDTTNIILAFQKKN